MARFASRVGIGLVVGGLLVMGASVAQRELLRRAGTRLIDWEAVRQIARRRLGTAGAPLSAAEQARAEAFYADALHRIQPLIAAEIGQPLPEALERPVVIDRRQWVDLNLSTFETLFGRLERLVIEEAGHPSTPARALARIVNRSIGNQQLGFLLAFLGRRVLGQYEVALLAASPAARGRLHFVEPNVATTAAALHLDPDGLRTMVALHEATHAYEFEAYPWIRSHFAELVTETLERLATDTGDLGTRVKAAIGQRGGHWLERLMTPSQLDVFNRTQALMSLLEGYSNHVMQAVGDRVLPGFTELHDRFERRNETRGAIERAILRVTGLDLKLEQYAAGERFVEGVITARGPELLRKVWTGPETLPSLEEIHQPPAWVARMEAVPQA